MKRNIILILFLYLICIFTGCTGCSNSNESKYDNEYWESVDRQKKLEDAGLKDAAKVERNSRINRMKGKGYTKPDGSGSQIRYQGSKEQKKDLDAIDEYMKNHPNF